MDFYIIDKEIDYVTGNIIISFVNKDTYLEIKQIEYKKKKLEKMLNIQEFNND